MSDVPSLALADRAGGEVATVLVVDDEPDVRLLIGLGLRDDGRFEVVAEATDGEQAVALASAHQPDIILLDLRMPGTDGREAIPRLLVVAPRSMVVVLSALQARHEASPVLALGAFAYVEKTGLGGHLPRDLGALLDEFRRALRGETVLAGRPAVAVAREVYGLEP